MAVQSGDVRNVIASAIELKKTQSIQDVCGLLREIRIGFDEGGIIEANKAIQKWDKELMKAAKALRIKYGLKTAQGIQGSFLMRIYNSIAALTGLPQFPEFEFKVPLPEFITKNSSGNFSALFKDISSELVNTERLGATRDLLAAQFVIDDEHYVPPKTEAPEYRKYASDWKIPM